MNKNQKYVLCAGIAIIVLLGLFPPFYFTKSEESRMYIGHHYYTSYLVKWKVQGASEAAELPGAIDYSRLHLEWFLVALVTAGLIVVMQDQKTPKVLEAKHE